MAIQLREETINLCNGEEALTILHISDVHVWFSETILHQLKAMITENDPDVLAFTGDYYDLPTGANLFREFLSALSHNYIIVFIRGNHDRMYGYHIADKLLGIPNCHCVEKKVFTFTSRNGNLYHFTSWDQRHLLKKRGNEHNIVLIHNPERLKEKEMKNIDLILAGHLHGGQFIFFQTTAQNHFPGCLLYKYCTDRRELEGTTVIVSKGVGDTLPLRWNCAKEVVKINIV